MIFYVRTSTGRWAKTWVGGGGYEWNFTDMCHSVMLIII